MSAENSNPRNRALRIGKAAALVGASVDSLREWDRAGLLRARRTEKGHRRYFREDLDAFMRRRATPPHSVPSVSPLQPDGATNTSAQGRGARFIGDAPLTTMTPWDVDVAEARAELEVAKARDEVERLNRIATERTEEAARRTEAEHKRRRIEQRLLELKSFGRDLARDLPLGARAHVVALMEEFVTDRQFPGSISNREAYAMIRDRVDRVRAEVAEAREQAREREMAALERQFEESRRKSRIEELIRIGRDVAWTETLGLNYSDAQRVRQAIERDLRAEVRSDWSEDEIRDYVMDIVDEWEDDDEEEGSDQAEDDDEEDADDTEDGLVK